MREAAAARDLPRDAVCLLQAEEDLGEGELRDRDRVGRGGGDDRDVALPEGGRGQVPDGPRRDENGPQPGGPGQEGGIEDGRAPAREQDVDVPEGLETASICCRVRGGPCQCASRPIPASTSGG